MGVSGETPKRELARVLADYESGKVDVLVNAQLLAEAGTAPGPRSACTWRRRRPSASISSASVASRVAIPQGGGIVIDFVHPATKHDEPCRHAALAAGP